MEARRLYVKSLIAEVLRKITTTVCPHPVPDIWSISSMLLAVFRRDKNKKRKRTEIKFAYFEDAIFPF
jgi:hypothetical protein